MKNCPYCGGTLHDEAEFCYFCMKELSPKKEVPSVKKSSKTKKQLYAIGCAVLVGIIVFSSAVIINNTKEKENSFSANLKTNAFEEYQSMAVAVTNKLNCNALWSPETLKADETNETWIHYTAQTAIPGVSFGLMLDNASEDAVITLENIPTEKMRDAKNIILCGIDSYYGYYLTDIDVFLLDDVAYPYADCPYEYFDRYADVMGKQDRYADSVESGSVITSKYKQSAIEGEKNVVVFEVRERANGTVCDITVLFYEP